MLNGWNMALIVSQPPHTSPALLHLALLLTSGFWLFLFLFLIFTLITKPINHFFAVS